MYKPRIVVAGTNSGSGKTTITMGLLALLTEKGMTVQGYKVGPDYIDPSYHTAITNRPARNLDTWMMSPHIMKEVFQYGANGADMSVIEGVMGLYDGKSGTNNTASTAEVASELDAPVILVVNALSQARSAAAVVHGFNTFDPKIKIAGVIFNNVSSEGHYSFLKEAVESLGNVEVLGYLPNNPEFSVKERHLGLVPAGEQDDLEKQLAPLLDTMYKYIDLDKIIQIATRHSYFDEVKNEFFKEYKSSNVNIPVAIAKDKAFSFYYQDNLDWMSLHGIDWVPVSPIKDKYIPDHVCGCYFGGGFPELYREELSENQSFIASLRQLFNRGIPIFGECGGFMYLTNSIMDTNNNNYPMAGLVPGNVHMTTKRTALGYREGKALTDSFLLTEGEYIRGHEFRYSKFTPVDGDYASHYPYAFQLSGRRGSTYSGYQHNNLLASYLHIHLASNPQAGLRWVHHLLYHSK